MSLADLKNIKIEKKGLIDLMPFLFKTFNGRIVMTNKGRLSKFMQGNYGDVFVNDNKGNFLAIEIKVEESSTGNLYLETWSNRAIFPFLSRGWLFKTDADWIFYYFLDTKILHIINLKKLKEWALKGNRLYDFPEKLQKKNKQLNKTYGVVVPVRILKNEMKSGYRQQSLNGDNP